MCARVCACVCVDSARAISAASRRMCKLRLCKLKHVVVLTWTNQMPGRNNIPPIDRHDYASPRACRSQRADRVEWLVVSWTVPCLCGVNGIDRGAFSGPR